MSDLSFKGFLESEIGKLKPQDCLFHVIPALYEKTVSYGKGTGQAPLAILEASQQLEIYDGFSIPSEKGIFTQMPLPCNSDDEENLLEISAAVARTIQFKKIPILLGGEHTVSVGAFHALKEQTVPIGIVQFDAHADLRETYEDNPLSHACVMRRAHEMGYSICQIGVRSLSPQEVEFRSQSNIHYLDAEQIALSGIPEKVLPDDFPQHIYFTIDVDAFDPSIIPATGTPEPGGLTWYQMLSFIQQIIKNRNVLGFDVVELAPIAGFHACEFTIAKLIYRVMGMIDRNCEKK